MVAMPPRRQGIRQQGMPWENYVGAQLPANSRLPANFKTFDYYNPISRTAISVKTLDTTPRPEWQILIGSTRLLRVTLIQLRDLRITH